MKKSRYFISARIDDFVLYYNLINDTLLQLPADRNEGCVKCLQNPNNTSSIYWRKLYEDKFIIEDDFDEFREIQRRHWKTVSSADELNLTVVSTLACNSECVYCYQRGLDFAYSVMTQDDFDGLYTFLQGVPQRTIHINWYGGEPLLEKDKILRFCAKADKDRRHTYSYSIATNGSIYDEKFYRMMERYGLTNVTVSMVGTDEVHSALRPSKVYDAAGVIRNIVCMTRYTHVVVNLNLCKCNVEHIREIFEELSGYRHSSLSFTFNRIVSYDNRPCAELELDVDTYMRHVIELSNWALDHQYNISDMSCFQNFGVFCGAYANNNYVVGPGLYLYLCDRFYDPEESFAQIVDGVWQNRESDAGCGKTQRCMDPYKFEECKTCSLLPYCNGGCNYLRDIGKNPCPPEKNYLEAYLKLYYRIFYEKR
ncbi:MAG: SPASM domain-containing protein [Lachnospiraceae bacterium]|nr:SPASM domain-containing protein [Lachnospiraceae bacterium]